MQRPPPHGLGGVGRGLLGGLRKWGAQPRQGAEHQPQATRDVLSAKFEIKQISPFPLDPTSPLCPPPHLINPFHLMLPLLTDSFSPPGRSSQRTCCRGCSAAWQIRVAGSPPASPSRSRRASGACCCRYCMSEGRGGSRGFREFRERSISEGPEGSKDRSTSARREVLEADVKWSTHTHTPPPPPLARTHTHTHIHTHTLHPFSLSPLSL